MSDESPYLSIVAVSRNDDHGGRLLERMQHFVDCLHEQVNLFRIPVELILVEWNPPSDRPSLEDAIIWPDLSPYFMIRIVTVPSEIHKRFQNSDKLPLFQMIGKNVGIRRASGQFILATNVDIIFSNELMKFISERQLKSGVFYRTNRIDVDSDIPAEASLKEKLEYCRSHVIRINSRYFLSNIGNLQDLVIDIAQHPTLLGYYFKNLIYKFKIPRLHYNACGDFTLMATEDWEALRGYPELEMFSLHIDSLFLMTAYYSGLPEHMLPSPQEVFHIEHSIGSGITPGLGQRILFQRLERDHIQYLTWRACVNLAQQFRLQLTQGEKTIHNNRESWGLEDIYLPEKILGA